MKATNIEQIREHLAKGGRVLLQSEGRTTEVYRVRENAVLFASGYGLYFDPKFNLELVPINSPIDDIELELVPINSPIDDIEASVKRVYANTGLCPSETNNELMQRIRQSLLYGHFPTLIDLLEWWEETTGELIELGRRCEDCNGTGLKEGMGTNCMGCNGSGYTVRPTWMGEK